ncbi:MAG: DUF2111 domain-containing protein [Methanoregulaceae archaeon]|nr:DUF2111 domain-containing protein [Methanoregulaceae archaeon]
MYRYIISASSVARDMEPVGLAVHELFNRLPVTARSRDHPGVRIEKGRVIDREYTGPVLEQVLAENQLKKVTPLSGYYKGIPVVVSPVRDEEGDAIAAIGVVDITGILDLATLMEQQSEILRQVCGSDPCPRPAEQTGAKR